MAIRTNSLQVRQGVIVRIAVNVVQVKLTRVLGHKSTDNADGPFVLDDKPLPRSAPLTDSPSLRCPTTPSGMPMLFALSLNRSWSADEAHRSPGVLVDLAQDMAG